MEGYIAPLVLLIVLFVGFGFVHQRGRASGTCAGCTGCADKSECTKENETQPGSG